MKKITHCRACGSNALTPVISIGADKAPKKLWRSEGGAIDYVLCDPSRDARACGLLQSSTIGSYKEKIPSGRHSSNRDHLRAVATESLELISGRDCSVLDIGCNDGSLLAYYPRWVERFGVDPADLVEGIGEWAWTAKAAFPSDDLDQAFGDKKFDIITAVSLLEHIDDPQKFLEAVKERLTEDGVFALETIYSPMVLTRNSIESLQPAVSAVYSLSVLEWMVREAGLKIFKGSLTSKEGGSIRLFITHSDNSEYDFDPWFERLARLWDEENALAMRANQPYQSYSQRIDDVREATVTLFEEIAGRGETAHILGADPQIEALLKWIGPAAKVVTAAVDTAAVAEERLFDGDGPRIISETDCRAAEPDFLIASARYKRELLERWREPILLGARMIFVTPSPHIVNASNFASEYAKAINGGDGPGGVETLRTILAASGGPRLIAENDEPADTAQAQS